MADRYDLLSYPVRLSSGTVAEDAVDVDAEAAARDGERGDTRSAVLVFALVGGLGVVYWLWRFAVALGVAYAVIALLVALGPDDEVVETEWRAVPAGTGERVVAAHERELRRRVLLRLLGVAVLSLLTLGVAYAAGTPAGLVTVGGFAVLLVVGAVTPTKSRTRMFAPELVRESVSPQVAREEAATIVEEPPAAPATRQAAIEADVAATDGTGSERPPGR